LQQPFFLHENGVVRPVKIFSDSISYELLRPIAQGGMGCVYEALQEGSDGFKKRVAIKIIRQEYSSLEQFRKNFIGEATLVADLIHANIVQTYHLGHAHKQYYMVMEYVHGVNLEQFMLQHRAAYPAHWPTPTSTGARMGNRWALSTVTSARKTSCFPTAAT
jgi:serine/threonine protein kinase